MLPQPRDSFGGIPGVPARPSEEGQPHLDPPGPPKRRWQSWKGNNKFFLDGERKARRGARGVRDVCEGCGVYREGRGVVCGHRGMMDVMGRRGGAGGEGGMKAGGAPFLLVFDGDRQWKEHGDGVGVRDGGLELVLLSVVVGGGGGGGLKAGVGVVVGSGVGVVGVNVGIVGVVFVGVSFAAGAAADCCCRRLA